MKKLGRPSKETEAVNVRLELAMIEKLDDARRSERDLPSRPEMIRRILVAWNNQNIQEK
jgi:metal-responsive CopG/Arc/MetJ family transcriptional regulator